MLPQRLARDHAVERFVLPRRAAQQFGGLFRGPAADLRAAGPVIGGSAQFGVLGRAGGPLEKSLFAPVYENELNSDEREVAVYLDGEKTLAWWHRNVARTQYGIQGWKKAKIYPDFIFAVQRDGEAKRITVLETKGDQLDNLDTAYKREALAFLSDHFEWDEATPVGELELVNNGETVEGTLILMSEWKAKLPAYL